MDKDSKSMSSARQNFFASQTQTSQSLSVHRTFQQRSQSVSSYTTTQQYPSQPSYASSLPRLDNKFQSPFPAKSSPIGTWSTGNQTDAKPFQPTPTINMNYQSPYRSSPAYRSFNASRIPPSSVTAIRLPAVNPSSSNQKLIVKKTGRFYDQTDLTVPTYQTHSKNRGEVLIINNVMFKGPQYRVGAKEDDKKLKDLFSQMGFIVTIERDLKAAKIASKIKDFSKKGSLKSADICVVVVMSHGTKNTTIGGTEVFGIDEDGVLVEDLLEFFNESGCKNMAGKPKIFIFQCCRGDNEQFTQSDARPNPKAVLADVLIAYSTLPGFVSYRNPESGTVYIQTLCDIFSQYAHEYDVEYLLKMVDVKMASTGGKTRQTTSYESRGFKRCYLHPK